MKKIDRKDILLSAVRKNLGNEAIAAEVLHETEKYLLAKVTQEARWKPMIWKNGIIRVTVESPAIAQHIYMESENLLKHLSGKFPAYRFREVRTQVALMDPLS